MALTLVQARDSGAGTATFSLAYTSNVTAGNFLIAVLRLTTVVSVTSMTDSLGQTWTKIYDVATTGVDRIEAWYFNNTAGGANTVTLNCVATFGEMLIAEYSGVDPTAAATAVATIATGSSSIPTSGSLTATNVNEALFSFCINSTADGRTITTNSGQNLDRTANGNVGLASATVGAGPKNAIKFVYSGTAVNWGCGLASFKLLSTKPAFVQAVGGTTNTASPMALAYSANNTAGNTLVCVGRNNGNTSPTISDSQGNTWVTVIQDNWRTVNSFFMYYALNCKAGANTVTLTATGTLVSMCIGEFFGPVASSALDKSGFADTGTGTWTTADSGNVTTVGNGEVIVGGQGNGTAAAALSLGSGYSNLCFDSLNVASLEFQLQAAAGTIKSTFTLSAVTGGCGILTFLTGGSTNQLMLVGCGT